MRINPFDLLSRAVAVPAMIWSAADALLAARRADDDIAFGSRFAARMSDGFFEHIEGRCRARWADLFTSDERDEPDEPTERDQRAA